MELRFSLDIYNTAEVFGAYGLLELASWQDGDAISHFESEGQTGATSEFVVQSKQGITLDAKSLPIAAVDFRDPLIAPVIIGGKIQLSWWLDVFEQGKNGLKMWAGDSCPLLMLQKYQPLMLDTLGSDCLQHGVKTKSCKSSFGFDLRASRDALKAGYSEKDAGEASVIYPETEFLCALGLQNFRPAADSTYYVWRRPVPANIAHGACSMEVPGLRQVGFHMAEFEMVSQSQKQLATVAAV